MMTSMSTVKRIMVEIPEATIIMSGLTSNCPRSWEATLRASMSSLMG